MDKITKLACLALLLVCTNNVSATTIHNTDATSGEYSWALNSHQRSTDRFSIDADAILAKMRSYQGTTRLHSDTFQTVTKWREKWTLDWGMNGLEFYSNKHRGLDMRDFKRKLHDRHPDIHDNRHHLEHVPAVPVPAAIWLFGSGLIGLIGFARKKA